MHVEFTVPDHAALIEAMLEGWFRAGELLVRAGAAGKPSLDWVLQDDTTVTWQLPTQFAESGVGDCEDLVIAWVSWLRGTGRDPRASARVQNTGPLQTHCVLKLGDGKIVDVYKEHLEAQAARGYAMSGWWSSVKGAVKSVGHGIASGAKSTYHGIGDAGRAVGRAAESTYHGVKDAAQYVAKDLPKAIIQEGASGIASLVSGVGGGVSTVVNSVGDVVAGGAKDALHQWGKLGNAVGDSFASAPSEPAAPAPDQGAAYGGDPGGLAGGNNGLEDYPDQFAEAGNWGDSSTDPNGEWEEGEADGDTSGGAFDDDEGAGDGDGAWS